MAGLRASRSQVFALTSILDLTLPFPLLFRFQAYTGNTTFYVADIDSSGEKGVGRSYIVPKQTKTGPCPEDS